VSFSGADLADQRDNLNTILERVVGGANAGDFHPQPGAGCRYCDYLDICDVAREQIIERKRTDPRVATHRALGDIS
jgi:hypothetical protein